MTWNIMCSVSGGVTGKRNELLKNLDNSIAVFANEGAAEDKAGYLNRQAQNAWGEADSNYTPVETTN